MNFADKQFIISGIDYENFDWFDVESRFLYTH